MGRLNDKVALVTGGASGIGEACARRFAEEGAKVVVADRDRERGAQVAASIGEGAIFQPLDVTSEAEWVRAVDEAVARFGGLDVLVNGAGVGVVKDVEGTTLAEWRFVQAVNVEGTFLGCQQALRVMKGKRRGSIINLSSIAGLVGDPTLAAYCASKGAVRLLSKAVALDAARKGYNVRCNSVHPSFIATPMVETMIETARDPEKKRAQLTGAAPLGRLGLAAEVAAMVLYLASDESAFVTGAELVIDGGLTAR